MYDYLPDDDPAAIDRAIMRLWRAAGYVEGKNEPTMEQLVAIVGLRLGERGLREIEVWPPEPGLKALLAALQQAEASTNDDDERQGLQRMREGAKRLSVETLMTLYRAWVSHYGGPGTPLRRLSVQPSAADSAGFTRSARRTLARP